MITDEQIRQLALYIVYDVRQYIQEHPKEYEEFLKRESIDSQSSDQQKGIDLNEDESTQDSRNSKFKA